MSMKKLGSEKIRADFSFPIFSALRIFEFIFNSRKLFVILEVMFNPLTRTPYPKNLFGLFSTPESFVTIS